MGGIGLPQLSFTVKEMPVTMPGRSNSDKWLGHGPKTQKSKLFGKVKNEYHSRCFRATLRSNFVRRKPRFAARWGMRRSSQKSGPAPRRRAGSSWAYIAHTHAARIGQAQGDVEDAKLFCVLLPLFSLLITPFSFFF